MNTDAGSRRTHQDLPRHNKDAAHRRSNQDQATTFCADPTKKCTSSRRRRAPGEGATHAFLRGRRASRLDLRREHGLSHTAAEVLAYLQDEALRSQNGDKNFGTSQISDALGYSRQRWTSGSKLVAVRPQRSISRAVAALRDAGLLVEVSRASFGGWLGSQNREAQYRLAEAVIPGSESTYSTFFARYKAEKSPKNKANSGFSCRQNGAYQDILSPNGEMKSKRKTPTHPISPRTGMAPSGREKKSGPALEIALGSPEAVAEVVEAIEESVEAIAGQRPDRAGVAAILRSHLSIHGQAAIRSASGIASAMTALGTRLQALQRQGGLDTTPTAFLLGTFRSGDPVRLVEEGRTLLARKATLEASLGGCDASDRIVVEVPVASGLRRLPEVQSWRRRGLKAIATQACKKISAKRRDRAARIAEAAERERREAAERAIQVLRQKIRPGAQPERVAERWDGTLQRWFGGFRLDDPRQVVKLLGGLNRQRFSPEEALGHSQMGPSLTLDRLVSAALTEVYGGGVRATEVVPPAGVLQVAGRRRRALPGKPIRQTAAGPYLAPAFASAVAQTPENSASAPLDFSRETSPSSVGMP